MRCVICKNGETGPGQVTVMVERGGCTIIFKDVPAEVCDNCAEYYLSEEVSTHLEQQAESAAGSGEEVMVLSYAA